ncbi:MAG: hypothetical protein K2Q10_11895, partial [Rhodospirillales bacterium]|nr:hypothetical protein [Rhodospirillales bacterium]
MALAQGKRIAVTALLRSAENRQAVAEALEDERHVALETRLGRLAELGAAVVGAVPPDLLLLDLDLDDEAEMAVLAGLINASGGTTAIAVTAAQPSLAGMRRLMRLGITDLVPQPIVRTDLLNALKAARDSGGRRNAESGGANGTVLAFLKAGGGVGATTLAVQAGCALAAAKGASVCLLDLDVQFGAAA